MNFYIYKDAANEWRWFLMSANNRKIADGAEGYRNKADCIHGIRLIQQGSGSAGIFEV